MSKIQSEIGLTFPDRSRVEHFFEADVVIDPAWVAKVMIPATSYESFAQVLLAKPTDVGTLSNAMADSTDWWKPENVVLTKQYLEGSQTFVRVVVSKEDVEDVSVYIECVVF